MKRHMECLALLVLISGVFAAVPCASASPGVFVPDDELLNSWGVLRIGAGRVHELGITGAGVKIGIIDSGIDYGHPEFSGRFGGGYDFVNDDNDPYDDFGHGTRVAGIIGAADDGAGVVGVAPQASLYAYKVFNRFGIGTFGNVIAALDRAILDGMQIVNMSLGSLGDPGPDLLAACNRALAAGIVLVASGGNFGTANVTADNVAFPARYDSVIAVAGTTRSDLRIPFSSTGPAIELAAPGQDILSTLPGIVPGVADYGTATGTSLAAAHVAGTAALLMEAGYSDVRSRLVMTAYDLGPAGFDPVFGYGLVDAYAAVVPVPSALLLALLGLPLALYRCRSMSRSPAGATAEPESHHE